jgi:iron complex outermembrane receptor protein
MMLATLGLTPAFAQSAGNEGTGEAATTDEQEAGGEPQEPEPIEGEEVEESITVFGEGHKETDYVSPKSILLPQDLKPITVVTTEDIVKYEPSVIIRRRFIGDANGVMGIRGSNMFQTTRSMVFADGIPLHYFLQTQWDGAPRWGLVNADEVGLVEVVYGPFSAEYSGNSMGGVVNIETRIPTEGRFHFEGMLLNQQFDNLGVRNDSLGGFRGFLSYGDRIGNFSIYGAMTRLQNDGQTQDFVFDVNGTPAGGEIPVTGSVSSRNEYGEAARYYGNTGRVDSLTDQFKLKLGYEFGDGWLALLNTGFEVRDIERDAPENYLIGPGGLPVWSGSFVEDGIAFDVQGRNFAIDTQDRETLLVGFRLSGPVGDGWNLQAALSSFDILEDETRASLLNPDDPAFTPAGTVRDYDDAAWQSAEIKLQDDDFFANSDLSFVTGYRWEAYELGVTNYNSVDYASGARTSLNNASGGDSQLEALYAQLGWRLSEAWDVTLGGRYEDWEGKNGFFNVGGEIEHHVDRQEDRFSPKFSLGYSPVPEWRFRLSAAKAYRFPIVEELYQNERRTNGTSIANANLEPEDGTHFNLMGERILGRGIVRVNLFTETVEDAIISQSSIVDNLFIFTFLPIDEVETTGVEVIFDQARIADTKLSTRVNLAYLDSEIVRNSPNPDIEGNVFPRLPEWRGHLLLNYTLTEKWDIGGGVRYSSDSYGDLDNADTARYVFGAIDPYTQLNLKAGYQVNPTVRFNLSVENLTDQLAFVHHPWPGRTLALEVVVDR